MLVLMVSIFPIGSVLPKYFFAIGSVITTLLGPFNASFGLPLRRSNEKIVKKLVYYDPHAEQGAGNFVFNEELIKKYVGNGAQISDSVAKRLVRAGFIEAKKFVAFRAPKPPKPKTELSV